MSRGRRTLLLSLPLALSIVVPAPPALAQVTANVGAVSNYVWRGETQTNDGPAVQGGIDFSSKGGFVVGTWVSNVRYISLDETTILKPGPEGPVEGVLTTETTLDPSVEVDVYGGYEGSAGSFSYKGLFTGYLFPDGGAADLIEFGASGGYEASGSVSLGLSLNYTLWGEAGNDLPFNSGDLYAEANADFTLPQDFGIGLTYGYYSFHDADFAYAWAGLAVTREAGDWGTFGLHVSQAWGDVEALTDAGPRDTKIWVSWLKTFEAAEKQE